MSLERIQTLAANLADAQSLLVATKLDLDAQVNAVMAKAMPTINKQVAAVKAADEALRDELFARPDLFEKPKTQTYHGIRVGYMKQKGKVVIADEERAVERLFENGHELEKSTFHYVKTSYSLIKSHVAELPGKFLKKIGVQIEADTDVPFIKNTATDVEKVIAGLLAEGGK